MRVTTMPSQRPRVALTLPDDLNAILDQVSDYQGTPKTKLITDILLECKPIFEQMLSAYKLIEENKEGTADIVKNLVRRLLSKLLQKQPHWLKKLLL